MIRPIAGMSLATLRTLNNALSPEAPAACRERAAYAIFFIRLEKIAASALRAG
jgi:hypothetical protein